jgi:hypothetical protein
MLDYADLKLIITTEKQMGMQSHIKMDSSEW